MSPGSIAALGIAVTSLITLALAIPMIRGTVRPNPWYGFRTARTLADERIWYPANQAAGRALAYSAIASLLATLLAWLLRHHLGEPLQITLTIGSLLTSLLIAVLYSFHVLRRL